MKHKIAEISAKTELRLIVALIRSRDFLLGFLTCFFMFVIAMEVF